MRKILIILLLSLLCVGCTKEQTDRTLLVGSEPFTGYFMPSEGLSSSYSDTRIRELLHGGELVIVDDEGKLAFNERVIKSQTNTVDEAGNVTYTFTLQDMVWSDETPITSNDYIFAFLLAASPEYRNADALDATGEGILGYWDYYEQGGSFQGIQKIDDKSFSLCIDANELPYYWHLAYVSVTPYPMHALVQKDEVLVNGEFGVQFQGDMTQAVDTFINEYNETLQPTCGPYTFVSYENGQVNLTRNPLYMGDASGNSPTIEHILVKEIADETSMNALLANEVDILEPVMEANRIAKGKEAMRKGDIQGVSYSRNGYGVLSIKTDIGPTKEVEVRRALGYMIDREAIIKDYMDGYGVVVDSDYAPMQWMYEQAKDTLDLPYTYAYSLKKANEQLDVSSYKYEIDGKTLFNVEEAKEGYYRYNEQGEVLAINHMASVDNTISDVLEAQLRNSAQAVGMKYHVERGDDATFQEALYFTDTNEQTFHIFNLGNEFPDIPDPYYASFACDFINTTANPTNYCNPIMDEIIMELRHVDASDEKGFLDAWINYIRYFNEEVPVLPLYSSEYFGFASSDLKGYKPNSYAGWARQISNLSWK